MKKIILMLTIVSSLTSLSASADPGGVVLVGSVSASATLSYDISLHQSGGAFKVIEDAQDYLQSGVLSVFLAQKVREVMAAKNLSEEEAMDDIVSSAMLALE